MDPSKPTEPAQPSPAPPARRPRPLVVVLRVVLIGVIILAMLGLAHLLRHPAGFGGERVTVSGAAAPDGSWPPEVDFSGDPPPPDPHPTTRQEADDGLRHIITGLMDAFTGAGDDTDAEATPEARRQRVADAFALPYGYPSTEAPAGLMPREARVLMTFDNPARPGCRMVLARVPGDIEAALELFYRHYKAMNWEGDSLRSPRTHRTDQPDRGWMVHFRKGRRERIVYARPRSTGDETLVAIYDPDYEGDTSAP